MHIRACVIVLLMMFMVVACASTPPTPMPLPTSVPAPTYTPFPTYTPYPTFTPFPTFTPTPLPSLTPTFIPTPQKPYATAFGIDYSQPGKYLAQGEQTRLSNRSSIDALRGKPQGIAHLGEIYFWIARGFSSYAAGGANIGKMTTDQLFVERRLSGCHDWALVYASIARDLGYPAVLIDTAGVSWAKRFRAGKKARTWDTSLLRCLSTANGCWSIRRTIGTSMSAMTRRMRSFR